MKNTETGDKRSVPARNTMKNLPERLQAIYKMIEKYCFDHEDPSQAIRNMRYFKEGYDAFGLDEEQLRILRNRILMEYDPTPQEIADLGKALFKSGKYEYGSMAFLLLKKHRPRMDRYVFEGVKQWLDAGVENWAHTDLLSTKITPVFLELEIATLQDFIPWRESASKWTRRAVPVTMIWLKKRMEAALLLEFITPMMQDPERVVHQGLGWFLRELWKVEPEAVEAFLMEHKDTAPRLIIQYATEKMSPSRKRLYQKTKKYAKKAE